MKALGCRLFFCCLFVLAPYYLSAQSSELVMARKYVLDKQYNQAIATYDSLYQRAPYDKSLYQEYLQVVIDAKQLEKANMIIQLMEQIRRDDATIQIDKGRVLLAKQQTKAAHQIFESIIESINTDNYRTRQIADAFQKFGLNQWAIKTYEKGLTNSGYFESFYNELLLLYAADNQTERAVKMIISQLQSGNVGVDELRTQLIEMIKKDRKILDVALKEINKLQQASSGNINLQILKVWLWSELGDNEKAVKELIRIDQQNEAGGKQVVGFAYNLENRGLQTYALPIYEYLMSLGKDNYFYIEAKRRSLWIQYHLLNDASTMVQKQDLLAQYEAYLKEESNTATAILYAQYADLLVMVQKDYSAAITYLEQAIKESADKPLQQAELKFKLADYYIYTAKVWDAVLLYTQVDKDFKEDPIGEAARYKNARLTYFIGDFEWAQAQLKVLKSATSELIANDALNLSVLITENMSPEDTTNAVLHAFAKADFLSYIKDYTAATIILDSLFTSHEKEPIVDDILMLKAKNALANKETSLAIDYLKLIVNQYNDDVLADDALYQLAKLYQDELKDQKQARVYFEQLITQFPNSTYVQDARAAIVNL